MNADWFLIHLDDPETAADAGWPGWASATRPRRPRPPTTSPAMRARTRGADRADRRRSSTRPAALPRPGHGADEPRAVRRRARRPAGRARAGWPSNPRPTEILLQVFSTSQHFSELLIRDPTLIDWLQAGAERRDREALIDDLWSILAADEPTEERARWRSAGSGIREMLRIGYNDIVRGVPAGGDDASTSRTWPTPASRPRPGWPGRRTEARYGVPARPDGAPARFVVLGLGKLGGAELNYSSDIDLIFLYDEDGQTAGPAGRLQRRVLRADGERDRPAARRPHRARAWPTASTCGCGPTASRGRSPARSTPRWATT